MLIFTVFSLLVLLDPSSSVVSATIIAPVLPSSSSSSSTATEDDTPAAAEQAIRKYQSQPALFGMQLEYDASYEVILQAIPDDPHLCAGRIGGDNGQGEKNYAYYPNPSTDANKIWVPQDGKTVALLAQRGGCSFEDKARAALAIDAELRHRLRRKRGGRHTSGGAAEDDDTPIMQFVVVYDDMRRPTLVPMSASDDEEIHNLGLVFVSSDTGNALLGLVETDAESDSKSKDGTVAITIDATAPWGGYGYTYRYGLYGEDYPREFILAAMAGFFMCLALLGCLLLCAQAGIISTDGNVVVFGRALADEIFTRRTGARRERPRLLAEEQVLSLPTVEYCANAAGTAARMERAESMPVSAAAQQTPLGRRSASTLDAAARNTFNVCDVCIEEYVDGEQLLELPCGHRYHPECILPWLTKRSSRCPHCRADVWDADPYAAPAAFVRPSASTPLVSERSTNHTYGSTSWANSTPLRHLRDAWRSSSTSSVEEIDIGIGARHEFSDSDTEDMRAQTSPLVSGIFENISHSSSALSRSGEDIND